MLSYRFSASRSFMIVTLLAAAAVVGHNNSAQAVVRTFVIDPSQSSLTAGGNLYGEPYNEQGPGSLVTSYSGTIALDLNGSSIQFVGGSVIDANTSGDWMPAPGSGEGSAPADYAAFTNDTSQGQPITIRLATRDLVADLTSDVLLSTSGGGGSDYGPIPMEEIAMSIGQGSTDWTVILNANGGSVRMGNSSLVDKSANNVGGVGSLVSGTVGQSHGFILTLPINVAYPIDGDNNGSIDSSFALTGQIVATLRTASYGDFDGDGDVDGADFVAWQTSFPSMDFENLGGDADGDGDVDGADFVVWQTNFPYTPSPGSSPVPEPASICLLIASVVCAVMGRRLQASRTAARGL